MCAFPTSRTRITSETAEIVDVTFHENTHRFAYQPENEKPVIKRGKGSPTKARGPGNGKVVSATRPGKGDGKKLIV